MAQITVEVRGAQAIVSKFEKVQLAIRDITAREARKEMEQARDELREYPPELPNQRYIRTGKRGRVYAALAGRVKAVGWHNGSIEKREGPYGWHLRTISRNTRDGHVYECVYAHFEPESTRRYTEPNEPPLKLGDLVRTGDHIAFSGLTGNIDGEHLHLSVKRDGVLIDPEPLFAEILK